MHTTGNIIGRPIRLASGETLGTVTDVVTPPPSEATPAEVQGFRVVNGTETHFIPFTAIREVRADSLITDDRERLVPTGALSPGERRQLAREWIGAPVGAADGATLGTLCGVRLNLTSARVYAYEVLPACATSPVVIPGSRLRCDEQGTLTLSPGTAALLSSMHRTEVHPEPKKEAAPWA